MKKFVILAVITALITVLYNNCTKKGVLPFENLNGQRVSRCNFDIPLVCDENIPHYPTLQIFNDVYLCLESEYEAYNDSFELAHQNLTDDQFDDYADSISFDEEATLNAWESGKGYTSLRTELNAQELIWINSGMNVNSDPYAQEIGDMIFLTMINSNGDVRIGNDLYHFNTDGTHFVVYGADCEVFKDAKNDPNYNHDNLERIIFFPPDTCERHETENGVRDWKSDQNKRFFWQVRFNSYISNSKAEACMRNFRKKNGNWKATKSKTLVHIEGEMWNNECQEKSAFAYKQKIKRRKKVEVRSWPPYFGKIRSKDVLGTFEPINDDNNRIDTSIVW
jgi:hypothetical protein